MKIMGSPDRDLYWGAYIGNVPKVKKFLSEGGSVNWTHSMFDNRTALHEANNEIVAEMLIKKGANVNSKDRRNKTPLHLAKSVEVADFLILKGADVNSKDTSGQKPRHQAVAGGDKSDRSSKTLDDTSEKTPEQSKDEETDPSLPAKVQTQEQKGMGTEPEFPWIGNPSEFKVILSKGMYESFDNRVFLAGACNCGKSTLASVLIGDVIPLTWQSTDGLVVYFGRNGIHLKTGEMVPLKDGVGGHAVFSNILRGQPNVLQTSQSTHNKSKSGVRNFLKKFKNAMRTFKTEAVDKQEIKPVLIPEKAITSSFTPAPASRPKPIVLPTEERLQAEPSKRPDVSKLNHFTVREDILEEVRNGR